MKRSPMPKRKTPLARKTPLKRGPWTKPTPPREQVAPPKVRALTRGEREAILEERGTTCAECGCDPDTIHRDVLLAAVEMSWTAAYRCGSADQRINLLAAHLAVAPRNVLTVMRQRRVPVEVDHVLPRALGGDNDPEQSTGAVQCLPRGQDVRRCGRHSSIVASSEGRMMESQSHEGIEHLPESVADVASVIGVEAALRIVGAAAPSEYRRPDGRRMTRRRVYVPAKPHAGHWLVELLGIEKAGELCANFGQCVLDLPPCAHIATAARDAAIVRAAEAGQSLDVIGASFDLSARHVRRILQGARCAKR